MKIKDLAPNEYVYGSLACAGCGGSIALRLALKVLGPRTVIVTPPCCLMGVTTFHPQFSFEVPCVNAVLPGTASMISGVVAGLNKKGEKNFNVLGLVGDGGTSDIGLQALSGAMERGDKFIYLCYDNEAYMNTGVQRSGATPYGAHTATTPGGGKIKGKQIPKKDLLQIAIAHKIPYVASASISFPLDYLEKVRKAMVAAGPSYIQLISPCPTGWGFNTEQSVEIGRLAVQTGVWPLMEYDKGTFRLTYKPTKLKPVEEYLNKQGRFSHLQRDNINHIQDEVNRLWARLLKDSV